MIKSPIVDYGSGVASSGAWGAFVLDPTLTREVLSPFGTMVNGAQGWKRLGSVDYTILKGKSVYAPIDGRVISVLWQSGWYEQDYEIAFEPAANSHYWVSLDHVNDPTIKAGDIVTAGQKIGTAGNWITGGAMYATKNPTYGYVELQVNYFPSTKCDDWSTTKYECPFQYFSPTLASSLSLQVTQLMSNWEAAKNNTAVYDESTMPYPGCLAEEY